MNRYGILKKKIEEATMIKLRDRNNYLKALPTPTQLEIEEFKTNSSILSAVRDKRLEINWPPPNYGHDYV
jgi:hypothetical protein